MTAVVTDEQIDACGFRMFELSEIAATMQMHAHPSSGGDYVVHGNKRERMAQYGNAVTPPVTELLLARVFDALGGPTTFKDLFCGAGGSSIGAELAGGRLVLGLNHWPLAIETHSTNFPHADHDCADVSALTTAQIRRYPDSEILLASPECTNHSLAKGAKRRKPQSASLFDDGPGGDDEQDRSRATMWDVVRFAEQKILKGKPYRAMIVENVVDAFKWGANDDGGLFSAWRLAMTNLGYDSEIVWLNSMFAPPTPQSRDRMYVCFWQKGVRRPDLDVCPVAWCPSCEAVVYGVQSWKRPDRPFETRDGSPVGAKYGDQYLYGCPECRSIVLPGAFPAATAIDFSIHAPLIGERKRPLATNTRERIRRGLVRLIDEPFAIRLLHGGAPKPLTLPLVTLTQRQDMAVVLPVAGNTSETTPGNRTRDASVRPSDTVTKTWRDEQALVFPNRHGNVPRPADELASPPILTGGTVGLVELQNHGGVVDVDTGVAGSMRARGFHHAIVVANYGPGGAGTRRGRPQAAGGWARRAEELPIGSITATDGHALVVPSQRSAPYSSDEPCRTVTAVAKLAMIVPPMGDVTPRPADRAPSPTMTTTTRPQLLEVPE